MVEVTAVVEANETGPLKVLKPVKTLFAASLAKVALSERLAEDRPVMVTPVTLRVPVRLRLVEVTFEMLPLVPAILVEVSETPLAFVKPSKVAKRLVEVAFEITVFERLV